MEGGRAAPPRPRVWHAFERRIGMSVHGLTTLVVVVAVLIVVSLPRLRSFARSENERDALHAVTLLARELPARDDAIAAPPPMDDLVRDLLRQLPDTQVMEGGRLLRRHGYVFAVRNLDPPPHEEGAVLAAEPPPGPVLAVHAWPWKHGPTGSYSFVALADGRVYRSDNAGGRWSGLAPAADWSWRGWRPAR